MVKQKILKLENTLLDFAFILFPFGLLLRYEFVFRGIRIPINMFEIILLVLSLIFIIKNINILSKYSLLIDFIYIFIFSQLLALSIFGFSGILAGLIYGVRLLLFVIFYLHLKNSQSVSKLLLSKLSAAIFFAAIFGWVQYFLFPDQRSFVAWGWDDHLYRLVGTFFDPGFLGLILSLGVLINVNWYFKSKNIMDLVKTTFLTITMLFTYSRASYLALFLGLLVLMLGLKRMKYFFTTIALLLGFILILPRPSSSGVELERLYSVFDRVGNYKETLTLVSKSPVFGLGINNICKARGMFLSDTNPLSHSCNGSDSSLLAIIAMSGVVGLFIFLNYLWKYYKNLQKKDRVFILSIALTTFIHSQFNNSLFYPWIYFVLAVIGVTYGVSTSRK